MTVFTWVLAFFWNPSLFPLFTQCSLFPLKKLYPCEKHRQFWGMCISEAGRQLPSALNVHICSFIFFLPVISVLQNPEAFFIVPHPSPTLRTWWGFLYAAPKGLESRAVLLMPSSTADQGLASGHKCHNILICECALLTRAVQLTGLVPAAHSGVRGFGHSLASLTAQVTHIPMAWESCVQALHQRSAGSLHSSPTVRHNRRDPTEITVQNH